MPPMDRSSKLKIKIIPKIDKEEFKVSWWKKQIELRPWWDGLFIITRDRLIQEAWERHCKEEGVEDNE